MLPIKSNLQSSHLYTNIHITPCRTFFLIHEWTEWSKQAQPGMGERRDIALNILIQCLELQRNELNLHDLNLKELPPLLPSHIVKLDLSNNQLTRLPQILPSQLEILYANNNQLAQLPEILPPLLKSLYVNDNRLILLPEILPPLLEELLASNNRLTRLPQALPTGLINLVISDNQLILLPEILPTGLRQLLISNNKLIFLPPILPAGLEKLDVRHNHLVGLPEPLPAGLRELLASDNQLFYLPKTLPIGLNTLDVSHNHLVLLPEILPKGIKELFTAENQLIHLPETLPTMLVTLYAYNNLLTYLPETLPTGLEKLDVSNNQLTHLPHILPAGLRLLEISNNPFIHQTETLPSLISILLIWDKHRDITGWKKIAQEKNANHFTHFLYMLHQQHNPSNTSLNHLVSNWITALGQEKNKDIREQTFAIAQMGTESGVDRASYYFNQMHSLFIEHRLIKEPVSISETFYTLRSLFRLQELEKISAHHVEQRRRTDPDFKEDIEIYLAYLYKLGEELVLPVYSELRFATIAHLTTNDLEKAKIQILDTDKKVFLRHLVNHSEVWKKKIETWNSAKWALANERYLDKIGSSDFHYAVLEALTQEGISSTDENAMRIMQQKMANEVLFQKRYPLTETFLNENNALSLIGWYDKPSKYG